MFNRRLIARLLAFAFLAISALPLSAQVERQLLTTTDLLDVYIKNSGKPDMVAIFDFTTPSRGVFEPKQYLTGKTRGSFIGANQGRTSTFETVFTPATLGKDFGVVFGISYVAANPVVPPVPASAKGASNIVVRMFRWPQSSPYNNAVMKEFGGTEILGVPYEFRQDGSQNLVSWDAVADGAWSDVTSPAKLASRITHVRFSVKATNALTRMIDLPCPSVLFNSPHATDAVFPRRAADTTVRNFNRHNTDTGITFDPWSDANRMNTSTPVIANGPVNHFILGNFYYVFDYLSWIFGSKEFRNADSSDWVSAPASTATLYGTSSGYAVAGTAETVRTSTSAGVVAGTGWNNGLPCITRYQAIKTTAINVLLNYDGKVNWIYRFLSPAYPGGFTDDGLPAEELGTTTSTAAIPANDSTYNSTRLRYLRKLTSPQLAIGDTSLQRLGPSNWKPTTNNTMDMFDFGAFDNVDPRTPMPWSYTLANTYYRTTIERDASVFDPLVAGCPGKTFVVMFPIHGMNDSKTAALDKLTAEPFIDYFHTGNSGLGKGSKAELPVETVTVPGAEGFNTGILSSLAAFGVKAGANNMAFWGAPWQQNPGTARSSDNPGLQTMTVSAGIPGSYKLASDNNGRNPHETYFRVAQWADPYRTDLGYGKWRKANGNPDDNSVVDGGKVHYYPSSDPSELEKNFNDLVAYIVKGQAALSAPATPSTGARITTQAFFGVFNTSRKPIWSGTLFGVGIDRQEVTDATGEINEIFTFYGANGEDTRPYTTDPITGEVTFGLSDFDNHHLWSSYDIFGKYLLADIPPLKPVAPGFKGVYNNTPLAWNSRNILIADAGNSLNNFSAANGAVVASIVAMVDAAGMFPATVVTAAQKTTEIQNFIDYIRGKNPNDATGATNRINTMGDIVNSAPLAVELSENRVAGIPSLAWPGGKENPHSRLIIVGTNMGQLHCFSETAYTQADGKVTASATELWSFIPLEAVNALYGVYKNRDVDTLDHLYMMDGDPSLFHVDNPGSGGLIGDTRVSKEEDAVIITGMRKGGRNYYALAVSSSTDVSVTPAAPKLVWKLKPLGNPDATIRKMGMSSAVPTQAVISTPTDLFKSVIFLSGGYANHEVNARYRNLGVIGAAEGLGKQVLALDPLNGSTIRAWDFSGDPELGSIPGGITPVGVFQNSILTQRIYWADFNGNVLAINSNKTATAPGFRLDSARIDNWIAGPRYIRKASANPGTPATRFTNRPDAFRLSKDYPALVTDTSGLFTSKIRPLTVMVSAGSGDRNNPADLTETYTVAATTTVQNPAAANFMFVWADRQDSSNLGYDSNGIPDSKLQTITDNTSGGTNWATSYSDNRVTEGTATFLWNDSHGYYFSLLDGTLPSAVGGLTHDKVLVSPFTKEGTIFFSLFNINGSTGFDCSANAFTRTFRQCDIVRPLALPTQVKAASTVGDVNDVNRSEDDCTGLAFYFNSLSSQLSDSGDRVIQGGAVSASKITPGGGDTYDKQVAENVSSLQDAANSSSNRWFRIRAWRVVR